jgi:hypothetical protein
MVQCRLGKKINLNNYPKKYKLFKPVQNFVTYILTLIGFEFPVHTILKVWAFLFLNAILGT